MVQRVFRGRARCVPADPERMLLPFQERWRADRSRLKLAEKSRQIGWTWTDALDSVEQAVTSPNDVWISSRDEFQAKLYVDDCKYWADLYQRGAEALGLQEVVDDQGNKSPAYVLRFPDGRTIYSLSSNPNAQAGKRGTRKLDEFALHKDPKLLYDIAYPGITWGGQLVIFSTHRGSANFFNRLILEVREGGNPKGISLHRVTLQDALDQGFLYKLQLRLPEGDPRLEMDEAAYFDFIRAGCTDEESFLQEYMCVPSDDQSAFLPYDLIDGCTLPGGERWELSVEELARSEGEFYLGVDVGRNHDLTVMWVLERVPGMLVTRHIVELKGMSFSDQEAILYELLSVPGMRRGCIDSTGLGMQFAERAAERFGFRAEGVRFTAGVKEELAYPLRAAFEDRALRIPRRKEIEADLRSVRKETTGAGNVRFAGERGANGHADRFWALALAVHAARKYTPAGGIVPVRRPINKYR